MYPDGYEKICFQWTQNSIASPEQTLSVVLLAVATASPEMLLLRLCWSCCFDVLPGIGAAWSLLAATSRRNEKNWRVEGCSGFK
ncbi:hypothetical protein KY284_020172 [Solanum tuberosum]|nr:hypothetical protein KY284_020172 [Solanum tuberosum]